MPKGNTLTLGQAKTEEKSSEITAISLLLEMLELGGCLVTIDTMGCQNEIAREVVDPGTDCLLAVEKNQGKLYQEVRELFEAGDGTGLDGLLHDYATTLNKGPGASNGGSAGP